MLSRLAQLQREVERRGHQHAAQGCCDGERRNAGVPKLAKDQLAFQFQGDDEEEQSHQAIIDPVL